MNKKVLFVVQTAIIAALYAALTYAKLFITGHNICRRAISSKRGTQRLSAFHPCGYTGAYAWMCAFKYLQYRFRLTA